MHNQIIQLDLNRVKEKADVIFAKTCGFQEGKSKHKRMAQMAEETFKKGYQTLRPTAIVSAFDGDVIHGEEAHMDDVVFKCIAFGRMEPSLIKKVYSYILTVGEVESDENDVMEQIYADIWGTAFADGALEVLEDMLKEDAESDGETVTISASFGPGFYGMDVTTIPDFFKLLDGHKIGVEAKSSSIMVPLKSCAGFVIAAKDDTVFPPADCLNCIGNQGGCQFCKNNPRR